MTVVAVSRAPARLRGKLTRWLCEVAPRVFVGQVDARVRAYLWEMVESQIGDGFAVMAYGSPALLGYTVVSVGCGKLEAVDVDGLLLFRRPKKAPARTEP